VLIIGAGPAGAIAAANLHRLGHRVLVLERETFPRFSIGESLLPHCMTYVEEAGMLEAVNAHGFQFKNGAAFRHQDRYTWYDFEEKFSPGPGTTFQVDRAQFDKLLADEAARQGVEIRYKHTITQVNLQGATAQASFTDAEGKPGTVECRFILDASGFGRVLPRLLDLEAPSDFPVRQAVFTHVDDRIAEGEFDRSKILVTVHPEERDIWYWLIPFSDGRCSIGVVATREKIALRKEETLVAQLQRFIAEAPELKHLLRNARFNYMAREIVGYSAKVKTLAGDKFALLGNAGEFLDPVFSSGVTIAMRSASTAAKVLDRQLRGENVDWQTEYEEPLRQGINTFRVFVETWYDGRFQDVIFYPNQTPAVRRMISSVLAGYAWDTANPFVDAPLRRMTALVDFCRQQTP